MFCYLFFYTGRQTFGFAIPGIEAELGLDKQTLGWVSAALLWAYALGQVVNGNLGDKFGGRLMMSIGAVASFALNWVTSFSIGFKSLFASWGLNGLAQSMAWAPGSRVVANWWGDHERGTALGFYVFAAGSASVMSYCTSLVVLDVLDLNWRWIFRVPVFLMLLGGLVVWLVARDKPSKMGFEDFADEPQPKAAGDAAAAAAPVAEETSWTRYAKALSNGRLLLAGLAIGFQNTVRYGLLIWVPVYFIGTDFGGQSAAKWISVALPVGMAVGTLTSGWISDRFMILAAVTSMAMFMLPPGHWFGIYLLFMCGFFAYGCKTAFWALAPDLLGRSRTGTAVGIMNFFSYAIAGLGNPFIGWMIQQNHFSATDGLENVALVFPLVAAFALAGALLAVFIRR
jgi:OPA family glycerol-3-phosphate transporter-like MFS transporter